GDAEGFEALMLPMEFATEQLLTVQLQDARMPQQTVGTTPVTLPYDKVAWGAGDSPQAGQLMLLAPSGDDSLPGGDGADEIGSLFVVRVSQVMADTNARPADVLTVDSVFRLRWPDLDPFAGVPGLVLTMRVVSRGESPDDGINPIHSECTVQLVASDLNGEPWSFGDPLPPGSIFIVFDRPRDSNAGVFARIRYETGKAQEQTFDCDWSNGFQLWARRFELWRVSRRVEMGQDYAAGVVQVHAVVAVGPAAHPPYPPQLTTEPDWVQPGDEEARQLEIPPYARRVSLLARFGSGGSPDIPLGQLIVGFANNRGTAINWIDAATAREALFSGDGLPLPANAAVIVLTNKSDDPIELGVLWHLGV
ncbi:MAG: hypothetical protein ABW061_27505, partial [Polyangiaceae bacterium]